MTHHELCERIETLLDRMDVAHLDFDSDGVQCRTDNDTTIGQVAHMLYTNNLNDHTKLIIVDDNADDGFDGGIYFNIMVTV